MPRCPNPGSEATNVTTVTSALTEHTIRAWAHRSLAAIGAAREELNALNVFPVPDGDTGTNLFLTMQAAAASVDEAAGDLRATTAALARGALLGARGNSGVIVSQVFKAISEVLGPLPGVVSAADVRAMLRRGADSAYAAVATPIEGTILTVARAAADAAEHVASDDVLDVVSAAADGARVALAKTPEQLEALRLAGVVDAGGRGLVVLLDAMVDAITGVEREHAAFDVPTLTPVLSYTGPQFEVMFLLDDATEHSIGVLRARLRELGDSLVMVEDEGTWNVHVHVDDAGSTVEAGIAAGRPHQIRITVLDETIPRIGRGVVVVTHGEGTRALVDDAGAVSVAAAPQQRASTAEFLEGITSTGAAEVIVLPSDKDNQATARAAAEEARRQGVTVAVVPTRSIVQSLAALAVHDPELRFEDDVVMMTRAAGATHYGAVTIAVRDALTFVGPCRVGDVLGLVDGDIVEIDDELPDAAIAVLRRMLATGGELLTVITGDGVDVAITDAICTLLRAEHPALEIHVHHGGQPMWPFIFGVE